MKLIKILLINIFVLFVFLEILSKIIFFHPTRFYYPISSFTKDIQQDWNVDYKIDWRSGHRISNCKKEFDIKDSKEVLIVGDSFAFGAGLMIEDTFFYKLSCNFNYNIKNLSAMGTGIDFYSQVIRQSNLNNVEEIILIFFDNDGDIKINNSKLMNLKNKLRYSFFSYTVIRSLFRKFKTLKLVNQNENHITVNNIKFNFEKNSDFLEGWFLFDNNKTNFIEKEFIKISEYITSKNKKLKLKTLVIPDPSVVSDRHRDFYKKNGSNYLPKKNELSALAQNISYLSKKYNFTYLPFYELMIDRNKIQNQKYYFANDFHLNKKGNLFLYKFLTKHLLKS